MRFAQRFVHRLICFAGLATAGMLSVGGCGPAMFDAFFEPGGEGVFGTLVDDLGSFEFILSDETGNIVRVDADDGTITPPTDGQDLSVARTEGGSLTVTPSGTSDVIVAVRGNSIVGDLDLQVDRDSLGGLAPLVRANSRVISQEIATCQDNQEFLDGACSVLNQVDLAGVADMIVADLQSRGVEPPLSAVLLILLEFHLEPFIDCCLAWDEFRTGGGSACSEG